MTSCLAPGALAKVTFSAPTLMLGNSERVRGPVMVSCRPVAFSAAEAMTGLYFSIGMKNGMTISATITKTMTDPTMMRNFFIGILFPVD